MGSSRVAAAAAAHTKGVKPKRKSQPLASDNRGGPAGGSGADEGEPSGILYIGWGWLGPRRL